MTPAIATEVRKTAAQRAAETRKANRLQEEQQQARQENLRQQLYGKLTDEQREEIDEEINGPFYCIETDYEDMFETFLHDKEEEIKSTFRSLLNRNVSAKLILAAIDANDDGSMTFPLGAYGMEIDARQLLEDVCLEDEFHAKWNSEDKEVSRHWLQHTDSHVSREIIEEHGLEDSQ